MMGQDKTNKKLATSTVCKNIVKQFVPMALLISEFHRKGIDNIDKNPIDYMTQSFITT